MRVFSDARPSWVSFFFVSVAIAFSGCSRMKYRLQADRDAYDVIAERNGDPRWAAPDYGIEIDPRSRYFDAYDPDRPPMPPDDPASHDYMHLVDGKKGWKSWHKNGERIELENPAWREALAEYVEIAEDGSVKLDVDSALRLAYVHSPNHQSQLEELYLSALDVTAERFRLDTQFFGGFDTVYQHNGRLRARDVDGAPRNGNSALTVGRGVGALPFPGAGFGGGSDLLRLNRRFATAGQLVAGIANSFVWEFSQGDVNFASSILNASIVQPLLRGAGKDVALEDLTFEERNLLANLRAYGQFRQGFYTQVAIGELGVTGPQRFGGSTTLQSFSGQGGVNGYLGLLQQLQQLRNSKDNLSLQLRTQARLKALYENELIDLVQVDQFAQGVESQRADVLVRENAFALAKDSYKQGTLGLPPDLPIELDESLIQQFQLFPEEGNRIQDSILELQGRVGDIAELMALLSKVVELQAQVAELPNAGDVDTIDRVLEDSRSFIEIIQRRLDDLQADFVRMEGMDAARDQAITDEERILIELVRDRLREGPADLKEQFKEAKAQLRRLQDGLSADTKNATVSEIIWLGELLRLSQGCLLVQSRARRLDAEPGHVLSETLQLIEPVRQLFDAAREDLARMDAAVPIRERTMDEEQIERFRLDREKLRKRFADLELGEQGFAVAVAKLKAIRDGLSEQTRSEAARGLAGWVGTFLQVVERLTLVPAQTRLEVITVESIDLESEDAFQVALANRLDFMNGRAALVDSWRQIAVKADALQANLTVALGGDLRTSRDNPARFDGRNSTAVAGIQVDAPFTRLLERNAYRESLIEYQRSRRGFIQSRDSLHLGLRALLRNLEQLRQNLEIQRRAVTIALRRVDQTQLELTQPRPPAQPGVRPFINQTTAINLISAQSSLQNTQNAFLAAWLNYYATRMRLYRELGIMVLDPEGRWIEYPIDGSAQDSAGSGDDSGPEELPLPPMVPAVWIEALQNAEERPHGVPADMAQQASYSTAARTPRMLRLPPTENASAKK